MWGTWNAELSLALRGETTHRHTHTYGSWRRIYTKHNGTHTHSSSDLLSGGRGVWFRLAWPGLVRFGGDFRTVGKGGGRWVGLRCLCVGVWGIRWVGWGGFSGCFAGGLDGEMVG